MPSKLHQMLIGLIGRKMKEKDYEVVAFDGNTFRFDGQKLKLPPTIKRHRPDIIGINIINKRICIGEAKTRGDLNSHRTKEQLIDYSTTRTKTNNELVEIIIGVPESAVGDLKRLLINLGLSNNDKISFLFLPEVLVNED